MAYTSSNPLVIAAQEPRYAALPSEIVAWRDTGTIPDYDGPAPFNPELYPGIPLATLGNGSDQ
jgi:hypothetical protein